MSLLLIVAARIAVGVSIIRLPLEDLLLDAYIVARVRIVSRVPVLFEFEGKKYVCGYRYGADVLRSYKGPRRSFDFFSTDPRDFGGIGHDHLVIASRLSPEQKRSQVAGALEHLRGLQQKDDLCGLSAAEIFTPGADQMFFVFDERARMIFREDEWLRVNRMSAVSNVKYEMRRVEPGGASEPYYVVRWSDVEKTIRKALKK